ncbi:MupA/Atu3671 family FMN-dependent luciferase-like monooxygenase [Chromobacterium sp. IIBBL 290-4]|uniref:MupA/Atu3671 family FMN-dependent luciferase-like monooxygenase n=1 Tax=Chromobacterium sp. IIBBL 290-4 TaxID=2953890 RepID=UPI0020B747CA|nr:MupA/Atu3671 family FMN-dependent luciferase-like monooxygenase [Chromobacterium sp. IIBBL 290-4]UTH76429.1 LLM class flavin-dependent oxidoreductase [Chromobacterium sp. IIBBL 290-4]
MTVEQLLGVNAHQKPSEAHSRRMAFSLLFFSDVRQDIGAAEKYRFTRDLTLFGDREGFSAVYFPERHFHEFGAIYPNSAVMAAHLIPQTTSIRFRTAGISLPLHHPAEIVEWWAMNDVLSGGRVDLGFGSGWNKQDFIFAPNNFDNRRSVMLERLEQVRRLWAGEKLTFIGPGGTPVEVATYPRPLQKHLNIWILVAKSEEAFIEAGRDGYNVFTMLYGNDLESLRHKIHLYREARREAGHDPHAGVVSLMLHTLIGADRESVRSLVEAPFTEYVQSSLGAHLKERTNADGRAFDEGEQRQILEYAVERYYETGALFGSVSDGRRVVDHALDVGVNEIACLMDFGVDYATVLQSLPYLKKLVYFYKPE